MFTTISRSIALIMPILMYGCSSLISDEGVRQGLLDNFFLQDKKLILYYENQIAIDDQLRVLALDDEFLGFNSSYDPVSVNEKFIQKFLAASGMKKSVSILHRSEWSSAEYVNERYAFFVNISPKLFYQRIPPDFSKIRMQFGVVVKVVPLVQILQGKGNMALKTSLWESRCQYDALKGENKSIVFWLANQSEMLHAAVDQMLMTCADKVSSDFSSFVIH